MEVCDNIKKSEAWYSSPKNEDSVEQGFSLVSESSSLLEEDCEGEFETDDEKEIEEHVRSILFIFSFLKVYVFQFFFRKQKVVAEKNSQKTFTAEQWLRKLEW